MLLDVIEARERFTFDPVQRVKDAPSRSIFDALDRIKSDSFARLDAANNIVPTIHRFASSERVEGDD